MIITPWDEKSVDLLEKLKIKVLKIASVDANNFHFCDYVARKKIHHLNIYLKELGVRYIIFLAIIFAAVAQVLDLNTFPHKNYLILEESLELLSALCLFATIFKIKSLNSPKAS